MVKGSAMQDRVAAGILETAAAVLAERGEAVSMAEIAEAAGVGRATLYRYFPNRDALLRGLIEVATADLRELIAGAELDTVDVRDGIARLARLSALAGSKYAVLVHGAKKQLGDRAEMERAVATPIRELFARGVADGTLRTDLSPQVLFEMFTGLLEKSLQLVARGELGVESAGAAITTVFLDGAGRTHPR
ncbi:TetR/AcrR family transcriptional regulator [Saccharopolyspora sp. K220]|uniref:TetR/AcrR family transcriptional regulator n=1 Tax=Saccharopolyspora soli TaxID=2926618 RepID=UPI001F55F4AF|nr:TetR/AcrR family transcriptional regulator [Saccharopolyspora soli]MCI2420188.1 TetR/AcrR family transcriptional regulator [Saccharopolyspora soli]